MNARQAGGRDLVVAGPVLAVMVMAGPVGAGATSTPALKGIGALSCGATGKVTFRPSLNGSAIPTAIKVAVNLVGCSGSNAGATVAGGQVTGTLTGSPEGDCGVTRFRSTGTLTVTYDVKSGHPKLKPTTLSFNQYSRWTMIRVFKAP